jgi:hypothetical protein
MKFKEAMETLNVKRVEAKKTKVTLEKNTETRGQNKQRLKGKKDIEKSTPISSSWLKSIRLDPRKNLIPKKQWMRIGKIKLTREYSPTNPTLFVEETKQQRRQRQKKKIKKGQ